MSKSRILFISVIICRLILGLYALGILLISACYILWFIDPSYFQNFIVENSNGNFLRITSFHGKEAVSSEGRFLLSDMTTISLSFVYVQYAVSFLLIFLGIRELKKVIESVNHLNTFREENVVSFRKIGMFASIYFLLNLVSFAGNAENTSMQILVEPTAAIVMLSAFLLSEIFKEGNKLIEESRMTI